MGRHFLIAILFAIIVGLAVALFFQPAEAVELKEVSITYRKYVMSSTDPLVTGYGTRGRTLGDGLDLTVNSDLFTYLFWNNTVHAKTDTYPDGVGGQFRLVGWEFSVGLDLARIWSDAPLTVGYYHYSRHALDARAPWDFPREDALEVKLKLYGGAK